MDQIDSKNTSIPEDARNVNITLASNQVFTVSDIQYTSKPSFIMVASGIGDTLDYTKELLHMTSQEAFVFELLMDNRIIPDYTKPYIKSNHSHIDNSLLSKSEKKKVYEGYKRLHAKDLIVRLSRGKYLINPKLVITNDAFYATELATYQQAVLTAE